MARQIGDIKVRGTIDEICFYRMGKHYYARVKPEISKSKYWKAACFEGSRQSACLLGRASRIASIVYREHTVVNRIIYQKLTGIAYKLLKTGEKEEFVGQKLRTLCGCFSAEGLFQFRDSLGTMVSGRMHRNVQQRGQLRKGQAFHVMQAKYFSANRGQGLSEGVTNPPREFGLFRRWFCHKQDHINRFAQIVDVCIVQTGHKQGTDCIRYDYLPPPIPMLQHAV